MNAIQIGEVSLALVFFKRLLAEQQEQGSLQTQNLRWSTEVMNRAFLTYSKK
jgi:hypothetical protein